MTVRRTLILSLIFAVACLTMAGISAQGGGAAAAQGGGGRSGGGGGGGAAAPAAAQP